MIAPRKGNTNRHPIDYNKTIHFTDDRDITIAYERQPVAITAEPLVEQKNEKTTSLNIGVMTYTFGPPTSTLRACKLDLNQSRQSTDLRVHQSSFTPDKVAKCMQLVSIGYS